MQMPRLCCVAYIMSNQNHTFIRIQGGLWRGRKLAFDDFGHVRPTKAMVKETLMSWVRPRLRTAVCLDLFSGSGSLGFELASQGAKHVVCLDKDPRVCNNLSMAKVKLDAETLTIQQWGFPAELPQSLPQAYDLLLVDPPFSSLTVEDVLVWLRDNRHCHQGAKIYIELRVKDPWPDVEGFRLYKHKRSGGVQFGLLEWLGSSDGD